jgi:hypothetical protein
VRIARTCHVEARLLNIRPVTFVPVNVQVDVLLLYGHPGLGTTQLRTMSHRLRLYHAQNALSQLLSPVIPGGRYSIFTPFFRLHPNKRSFKMKSFNVEVPTIQLSEPRTGHGSGWTPLNPRTETLPKGWKGTRSEGIKDDILVEHDVAITVRDGVKLYADVFRPANAPARSIPALICWSPFGKKFNGV